MLSKISDKYSEESDKFRISGKASLRDTFIAYMKAIKQAHEVSQTTDSLCVRNQLLQNAWVDVIRCQTLWKIGAIERPQEVLSFYEMNDAQISEYILELERRAGREPFSVVESLSSSNSHSKYDPEPKFPPLLIEGEWTYLQADVMKKDVDDVAYLHQKLDTNVLKGNAEIFRESFKFLEVVRLMERRIRLWKYPPLTALLYFVSLFSVFN